MTTPKQPRTAKGRYAKQQADQGIISPPTPRGVQTLAALGLVIVAIASVAGLVWNTVFYSDDPSALVSISSIAVGGLIALAGGAAGAALAKRDDKGSS